MDFILLFETWIILAIVFILAEIFIPGGILANLGIASLIVAGGVYGEFLDTWVLALTTWFICSSIMLFVMYFITDKYFQGHQSINNTDEDLDMYGKKVNVTEDIGPGNSAGRVDYQGTTWSALGDGTKIDKGTQVTIICKENISLIVEPEKA